MSLTGRKFIWAKRLLARVLLPSSNLILVVMLLGLPFLYKFKFNTSVQEHGYLNRYSMNELLPADFEQMQKLRDYLLGDSRPEEGDHEPLRDDHYNYYTFKNNYTHYEHDQVKKRPGSGYSYWSDAAFEDTPEIYVKMARTLRKWKNIQTSYNRFKYTFPTKGRNSELHGHSLLLRLNCMRCLARGATLMVATVNTDNFREDLTSALLGLTAIKHFAKAQYLSQNIFLLVTMRQLPFAVGTRQFLHDYFNSHYFKHRSGTIHNALVIDLGTNLCKSYLIGYEGIDGLLPNQDIVNIFVEISDVEGLTLSTRGLWQSVFRMAVNVDRMRHHVPLLEKNINAFSVLCKGQSTSDTGVNYNTELLLKSLVLTVRNQNNLHTVLERSFNFYYFVKPTSFVSISIYSLVVPLLFIRQIVRVVLYPVFDNLQMVLGIVLVFVNILLASAPAYVCLLRLVRENSGNTVDPPVLNKVRSALSVLVLSYVAVFYLNYLLYRTFKDRFGDDYFSERSLLRDELISKIRKLTKAHRQGPLEKLKERLQRVKKFLKRRLTLTEQLGLFKEVPDTRRTETSDMDLCSGRDTGLYAKLSKLRLLNDSMGPYWFIMRVPDRLPPVDLFLLYSTYFVGIAFSMGLSVLNWALCFLLTLSLLLPFNLVGPRNEFRVLNVAGIAYLALFTLFMYPFKGPMGLVRARLFSLFKGLCDALDRLFSSDLLRRLDLSYDVATKFAFLKEQVFGARTHWINSTGNNFLLRKIYSASENHLLLGSYNLVILLFVFGILAHMLFLNVVSLFLERPRGKRKLKSKGD